MFASEDLKADRGVMLEAVKHDGPALEFASKDLCSGCLKAHVKVELVAAEELVGTFMCAAALPKRPDRGASADTHDRSPPSSERPRLAADIMTGLKMTNTHCPHHDCLFKERLAAFAGVPMGARLALLRAVSSKLGM